MDKPEWLRLLDQAYTGVANGTVKQELFRRWGEGKQGQDLLEVLTPKVEAVWSGLEAFGTPTLEARRGALDAALQASPVGSASSYTLKPMLECLC